MDAKLINPFIDAFHTIMPQIGFTEVKRGNISLKDKTATSKGVTVLVGLTKELGGNVAYNMSEETAKFVASTMMMGMPVESMDDMAQSAISELANMLLQDAGWNDTRIFDALKQGQRALVILEPGRAESGGVKKGVVGKAAVLAEGDAKDRTDIIYLEPLPLFFK